MLDLLSELSNTPVPNVLVIAGIVFLLLAVAGKVGANLSVPPNRQKTAALVGTILLVSGIAIFMVPPGSKSRVVAPPPTPTIHPQIDNNYITEDSIKEAIENASLQEIRAKRYLKPITLELYYEGEALRSMLATINSLKQFGEFRECKISRRQYDSIDINKSERQAIIDMAEDWNCASYSVENGNCLAQYASTINIQQTVILKLRASKWMVNTIKLAETNKGMEFVKCTNSWPANIKF
jgi:hypothetical protein